MLPRHNRLTKKEDFDRVFAGGAYLSLPFWTIRWKPNDQECSRFGFVVANAISKKATIRNTIKRRLRECVRRNISSLPLKKDVIIIAKKKLMGVPYRTIEPELLSSAEKMNRFVSRNRQWERTPHSYRVGVRGKNTHKP